MFADYRLANSIAELFRHIPSQQIENLYRRVEEESRLRGMDYEEEDGSERLIHVFLRPRLIDLSQRDYFSKATRAMDAAFNTLFVLRAKEPAVREILPLPAEEEDWFNLIQPGKCPLVNFSRWDANADFSGRHWKGAFHFLEVNGVGVGGIHYCPTLEGILYDVVYPELKKVDPDLVLQKNDDARDLLLETLRHLAKALGRPRPRIGFLVDLRCKGGPNEFPKLTDYANQKGLEAICCDPRDLHWKDGEIYHKDFRIDILYRDTTLSEFLEMQAEGEDMSPLRHAFAAGRVVSSLGGELDHKSCFEIFSNPDFHRWFAPAQRRFFKRHVLWTRLLRETRTTDFQGRKVDLIKYVRQRQDFMVLKPNRGFGGEGIVVGERVECRQWEKALHQALQEKGQWVVQRKAPVHSKLFPILHAKGKLVDEKLNVVCGFIVTDKGFAILGRASRREIVNVAQGGGMTGILLCLNR